MNSSMFLIAYILLQIMCVESGGKTEGFHPDGKSYGYFGLTKAACEDIGVEFPPRMPTDEYNAAKKYLVLLMDRHDCDILTAVGWYHGGNEERREAYIEKIINIQPMDYPEAFGALAKIDMEEK